jgi:acyl-CoA hydrolase
VLPEFLNDQGFLFGGNLLKWVDESAYITASLEFPGNRLVTVTSVSYKIDVLGEKLAGTKEPLFVTKITFVNVGDSGEPRLLSNSIEHID